MQAVAVTKAAAPAIKWVAIMIAVLAVVIFLAWLLKRYTGNKQKAGDGKATSPTSHVRPLFGRYTPVLGLGRTDGTDTMLPAQQT